MHFDYKAGGAKDLRFLSTKAFQQLWNLNYPASKISEDGKFGAHTHAALMSVSDTGFRHTPKESVEAKPIPKVVTTFSPSLSFGMSGSYVMEMQQVLVKRGFLTEADGVFGQVTQKAVRKYQASSGLDADGVVGMGTRSHLGLA